MARKGVTYSADGTVESCVFCRIINRTEPGGAQILFEDDSLVVFRPRDPCAEKHFLVVPRRHIRSVKALTPGDQPLVRHMWDVGTTFLNNLLGTALPGPRRFVFHVPPGNSIDHLHLHAFEGTFKSWWWGKFAYYPGRNPFCEDVTKTLATRFPTSAL